MTDEGDKPAKPDPFAPLPLANLPPVRRERSGATSAPSAAPPVPSAAPPAPSPTPAPVAPPPAPHPGAAELAPPAPSVDQAWDTPAPPVEPSGGQPMSGDYGGQAWSEAPPVAPAPEPPLLAGDYNEAELRDAVGATPRVETSTKKRKRAATPLPVDDDDDDGQPKKKSRKSMLVAALSIVAGGGIAALVFLGKANSARYYISCEAERVVVEQGRSFPPWGASEMDDAQWKPLKIPPEAPCHPQETEDLTQLALWYKTILVDQATKLLTAREVTKVDDAEAALKQALLVSRSLRTDGDAKDARTEIDRLLGDVVYWRASARLRTASDTLADAAKQFDTAAAQRPAHFNDAAEWAAYTRRLMDQLKAGPAGVPASQFPPVPPSERPTAPPGSALPVEPDQGSGSAEPPPPAPDAGVPTGGVLL